MRHGLNQQDLRAVSMADREERDSGKRCESVLERKGSRRSAVYILGMAHAHWLTPSNRGPISIRAKHVTAYSGRYTAIIFPMEAGPSGRRERPKRSSPPPSPTPPPKEVMSPTVMDKDELPPPNPEMDAAVRTGERRPPTPSNIPIGNE